MQDDELALMDWKRFYMFTDGDKDEAQELIDLFVEGAEESLAEIFTLCSDLPSEEWRIAIHKLKGSVANLGADLLARRCKEAELKWEGSRAEKQKAIDVIVEQYAVLAKLLENPVLIPEES